MRFLWLSALFACLLFMAPASKAEIIEAAPDHFTLQLEQDTHLTPEEVWEKLIIPSNWWLSDHTYSGDAKNLSLDLSPGGLWAESWEGGQVYHGRVLLAQPAKVLRLEAPFGPLQELAVNTVWTITITPTDRGSRIRFDFIANGSEQSGLDQLAPAVNYVKSEALESLAAVSTN